MAHTEAEDHALFELVPGKDKKGFRPMVTSPSDVLQIHTPEEMQARLQHYQRFVGLKIMYDTQGARKRYVEKVRPALRYYCKKFSVAVPDFLKNDRYYTTLPDEEKQELFGTTQLNIREFTKVKNAGDTGDGNAPAQPNKKAKG